MKILHILDKLSVDGSKVHGPGRQITYRVPYYGTSLYEVRVCSLRADEQAASQLREAGIDTLCFERSKFDMRALSDLHALAQQWKPDILHLHGFASWFFGRLLGRMRRIPVVIQEHFDNTNIPLYQKVADRLLASWQDYAIAVSESVQQFMVEHRYIRSTPIEVIWNCVPVAQVREAAGQEPSVVRKELGVPTNGAFVVGIVGRLAPEKGHQIVLDAIAQLANTHEHIFGIFVGDGPLREELMDTAAHLGISDRVFFAGYQGNVARFYVAMDVTVVASSREGFSAVALESLAMGVPVILPRLDVFQSIYQDGYNARMVEGGDPKALAYALQDMLEHPDKGRRLVQNAEMLVQHCDAPAVAQRYLKAYHHITSR